MDTRKISPIVRLWRNLYCLISINNKKKLLLINLSTSPTLVLETSEKTQVLYMSIVLSQLHVTESLYETTQHCVNQYDPKYMSLWKSQILQRRRAVVPRNWRMLEETTTKKNMEFSVTGTILHLFSDDDYYPFMSKHRTVL